MLLKLFIFIFTVTPTFKKSVQILYKQPHPAIVILNRMTEPQFTRKINKLLPSEVYSWKVSDRFTAGVPDSWYSGSCNDLWVEYKYLKKLPVRAFTPRLSDLQKRWLNERHKEGRNVAVVVGAPEGAFILRDGQWNEKFKPITTYSHKETAAWITKQVA